MVVAYVIVGLVGGLATSLILWWLYGPLAAFLGAPFGASLLIGIVALRLALRADRRRRKSRRRRR